jgi:hypothetical protein
MGGGGEGLRRFVTPLGWPEMAAQIRQATEQGRRVFVTVRSAAAELYALPWELLTLKEHVSLRRLSDALSAANKAEERPISVLHLLCHGAPVGSSYGLVLDGESPLGESAPVDAGQLYARATDGDDSRPLIFRPYPGLSAFGLEERRFYFGREALTEKLWQRMRRSATPSSSCCCSARARRACRC